MHKVDKQKGMIILEKAEERFIALCRRKNNKHKTLEELNNLFFSKERTQFKKAMKNEKMKYKTLVDILEENGYYETYDLREILNYYQENDKEMLLFCNVNTDIQQWKDFLLSDLTQIPCLLFILEIVNPDILEDEDVEDKLLIKVKYVDISTTVL